VTSAGETIKIELDDFQLEPTEWWTSPKSKARYPVAWKVSIPKLAVDCIVRARFNNQELSAEPFSYWEGAVSAEGRRDEKQLKGKGYLEMTGYAGAIVGMQAK
jgi:predicted secreted hydrolase